MTRKKSRPKRARRIDQPWYRNPQLHTVAATLLATLLIHYLK
ncbi:hypothetical protein [Kribbella sp. NPDC004536]